MSRLGKIPVLIPEKVKVAVKGNSVEAEGPFGKGTLQFRSEVSVAVEGSKVLVKRSSEQKLVKALHGTTRAHVANLMIGVSKGFEKVLEINGVGYNGKIQGDKLVLTLGFSHTVELPVPKGVVVTTPSATTVEVKGVDPQRVGEFAAQVRRARPVEPYNLKGIKYRDEVIRKKAGKTFVTGAS
jgi:large subunit ribosomal protein L6